MLFDDLVKLIRSHAVTGEELEPLLHQIKHVGQHKGVEFLRLLQEHYGNDVGERLFNLIDIDNDGMINDTIPDLFSGVGEFLVSLFD